MDQNIFISCRRGDSEGYAVRIYDRLQDHFGINRVFMDVTDFSVSENFKDVIDQAISSCRVMILIIGPHWDSITDEMGRNRLDDPHDFVRVEVQAALDHEVLIVPILVNRGKMPKSDELPYELRALSRFRSIEIHPRRFASDIKILISEVEHHLGEINEKDRKIQNINKDGWFLKISGFLLGFVIIGAIFVTVYLRVKIERTVLLPNREEDAAGGEIAVLDITKTNSPTPHPPDETAIPTLSPTLLPTETSLPMITFTPTPTSTSTDAFLVPQIIDTVGVSMVLVPQGPFTMGTNGHEPWDIVSRPASKIGIDMFYIDKYEVSNDQYADCVLDSVCKNPFKNRSKTRQSYFNNPLYADFPVIYVSWNDAKTYCSWRGGRLPIESEWEKAARGEEASEYPWGQELADCQLANFWPADACKGDTMSVDSLLLGASPYGILNMSGNVNEWVEDWFQAYPGGDPSATKEFGVTHRVVRGGAYFDGSNYIRSTYRKGLNPETSYSYVGFRCVIDIEALP